MPAALGDRSLFPRLQARVYLNHAAISPPSMVVTEAIRQALDRYAQHGLSAFPTYLEQRARLKQKLATLIGARADDLALVANTTTGVLDIAWCLPWKPGDRVLCFSGEFPTNVTPWQRVAEHFGLELVLLPLDGFAEGEGLERVAHALKQGARLLAVSAVQFQTGLAMPLKELADLAHTHGAELFVDGIQAVGAVPLDVGQTGIDYLSCGSHKWLMAPEGCAFVYVRPGRALVPRVAGWLSHEDGLRFLFEGHGHLRYDRPIKQGSDFLEVGAPNTLGLVGLEASVDLLLSLGVPQIFAHVQAYHDALERGLVARGFTSLRAVPGRRSAILSMLPPPGRTDTRIAEGLGALGISVGHPDGRVRMAPHWPNALHEVPVVLEAVDRVLA